MLQNVKQARLGEERQGKGAVGEQSMASSEREINIRHG